MLEPELLEYEMGAHVRAFSTTRNGGCSTGLYASFNANAHCGDDKENVLQNRKALCVELKLEQERLVIPHQVHQKHVLQVGQDFLALDGQERADALEGVDAVMTHLPHTCVSVSTADCIPILLYDEKNHAVAAVHAGWRGTVLRIAEATLGEMHGAYGTEARDVKAVIGPGISLEAFEVGDEVHEAFRQAGFPMEQIAHRFPAMSAVAFSGEAGKWHIDLWEANRLSMLQAGLLPERIHLAGICTYRHHDRFFSARRLGIRSGRILNGIFLTE